VILTWFFDFLIALKLSIYKKNLFSGLQGLKIIQKAFNLDLLMGLVRHIGNLDKNLLQE